MIIGEVSDSIPIDLIIEILSRLPAKSIARFRCVSKLWRSMLLRRYFTELFLTRSSARPPRLLFVVEDCDDWCFFTSPQPQNPYDEKSSSSSLVVAADFHMEYPKETWPKSCGLVSGFIYFRPSWSQNKDKHPIICNPSTGQYASFPLPKGRRNGDSFLGFDPIDKQFKVLYIARPLSYEKEEPDQILTLGSRNDSWRKIHWPLNHFTRGRGICINGILYYVAKTCDDDDDVLIVCFDVRSEKFKFIYQDFFRNNRTNKLINYKGKLGVITLDYGHSQYPGRWRFFKLYMRVIKDVEKSEWSECFFFCLDDEVVDNNDFSITATGEIVLSMRDASGPFYVFFFHLERSDIQSVEIQGLRATHFDSHSRKKYRRVKVFVDHVENLEFIKYEDELSCKPTTRTKA